MKTDKVIQQLVRKAINGILSDSDFWEEFDEVVMKEMRQAHCYLEFDKDGIDALLVVGDGDAAQKVTIELSVDDYKDPKSTEQYDETREVVSGIEKTIVKLNALHDELSKILDAAP